LEDELAQIKKDIAEMKEAKGSGSISEVLEFTTDIGGTIILQGVNKANDGSDKGRIDGSYYLDLSFRKEFSNGGIAYVRIEGYNGEGLNNKLEVFSDLNYNAYQDFFNVSHLWYEQSLLDKKFTFTFGKLRARDYFDENEIANDDTCQFLAAMFINNTTILFPDNQLGIRAKYSPAEFLDITYAYVNQDDDFDNIDANGFNAVQATYKLPGDKLSGNYRLMYWSSNSNKIGDEDIYGFALSFDQSVSENLSLFARYGYKNPKAYTDENPLENSWSLGVQVKGKLWNRENDAFGWALGQNIASKEWADAKGFKNDSETQTELYYKLSVSDHIAISPVFQYVSKPMGGNASADNDLFTFGIRTQINF
ncbi:MAG: carbohydrate porin, partial [Endomicrobia bacterium]|nr:carbohydrate porin [Endomicrobiia bacterium]